MASPPIAPDGQNRVTQEAHRTLIPLMARTPMARTLMARLHMARPAAACLRMARPTTAHSTTMARACG